MMPDEQGTPMDVGSALDEGSVEEAQGVNSMEPEGPADWEPVDPEPESDPEPEPVSEPEPEPDDQPELPHTDDADSGEEPVQESQDLDGEEALRQRLNELAQENETLRSQLGSQEPAEAEVAPEEWITADQFDELSSTPEGLNQLLNQVYKKAVDKGRELALSQTLPAARAEMQSQLTVYSKAMQFYTENPDLSVHKSYVSSVATRLASEHPDWDVDKIYQETASQARSGLQLSGSKPAQAAPAAKKPAPAKQPGGAPRSVRKPATQQKQLSELEKDIESIL